MTTKQSAYLDKDKMVDSELFPNFYIYFSYVYSCFFIRYFQLLLKNE